MGEPDHRARLLEGPAAWNAWRDAVPEIVPDLRELFLSAGQCQFGPAQGGPINLALVKLSGAKLRHATLIEGDLRGSDLTGAILEGARLRNANFSGARLTEAKLNGADLTGVDLTGADLSGSDLSQTTGLTQLQIGAALGDEATLLPKHLERPLSWRSDGGGIKHLENFAKRNEDGSHYAVLGVSPSSTRTEIRSAYLALAKIWHPDANPGNLEAERRFKDITSAANILLDEGARRLYDQRLRRTQSARRHARVTSPNGARFAVFAATATLTVLIAGAAAFFLKPGGQTRSVTASLSLREGKPRVDMAVKATGEIDTAKRESAPVEQVEIISGDAKGQEAPVQSLSQKDKQPQKESAPERAMPEKSAARSMIAGIVRSFRKDAQPPAQEAFMPPAAASQSSEGKLALADNKPVLTKTPERKNPASAAKAPEIKAKPPVLVASLVKKPDLMVDGVSRGPANDSWPGTCKFQMTEACRQGKAWCGC